MISYRNANSEGGLDWETVENAAFYSEQGLDAVGRAASSSANSCFKYAYRGMAETETAATKTPGNISKTTRVLGYGATSLGVLATGAQFYYSDKSGADYARLIIAGLIMGANSIPVAGQFISVGLGVLDTYSVLEPIYNSFDTPTTIYRKP